MPLILKRIRGIWVRNLPLVRVTGLGLACGLGHYAALTAI